jgi:hypothetical protein
MARSKNKIRRMRHRWVLKRSRRRENRKAAKAAPASPSGSQAAGQ